MNEMEYVEESTEETCDIKAFERNKYFYGKLMTVRDFETEQRYFNEKRSMLNRLVHGIGLVCGLEVKDAEIGPPGFLLLGEMISPNHQPDHQHQDDNHNTANDIIRVARGGFVHLLKIHTEFVCFEFFSFLCDAS